MGETIRAFKIQSIDTVSGNRSGYSPAPIVIDTGIIGDVPGLELISGGDSQVRLSSIAIGRQGRFLFWGFTSDPSDMTAAGRDMFLNCIYYIYSKRNTMTVPYHCPTRRILTAYLEDAERRPGRTMAFLRAIPTFLVPEAAGPWEFTIEFARKWLDENLDYLYPVKLKSETKFLAIDADARSLRTPNNQIGSLRRWIELARGEDGESKRRALACLDRYVAPEIRPKDGEWSRWLDGLKNRIVFVDTAGFRFVENP